LQCEITSVHAGAENRTAIHLQPFQALCQLPFFGFHRFFPVFIGFVRKQVHFSHKFRENISFYAQNSPQAIPENIGTDQSEKDLFA
jgi:hypothetical protein